MGIINKTFSHGFSRGVCDTNIDDETMHNILEHVAARDMDLQFKVCDKAKRYCYSYLCKTMSECEDESIAYKMINAMVILDQCSKNNTEYLLKSMRIGMNSFNDIIHIGINDTLSRSKLNKILSDIARLEQNENINKNVGIIKNGIDDLKYTSDQYLSMVK